MKRDTTYSRDQMQSALTKYVRKEIRSWKKKDYTPEKASAFHGKCWEGFEELMTAVADNSSTNLEAYRACKCGAVYEHLRQIKIVQLK